MCVADLPVAFEPEWSSQVVLCVFYCLFLESVHLLFLLLGSVCLLLESVCGAEEVGHTLSAAKISLYGVE